MARNLFYSVKLGTKIFAGRIINSTFTLTSVLLNVIPCREQWQCWTILFEIYLEISESHRILN